MHRKVSSPPDRAIQSLLALAVLVTIRGSAGAQIRFVPGPQRIVASAPKFIVAADFNNDRITDVAVTNSISNTVTVLFGATDSPAFGSMTTVNIGRTLRGLRAGDLNSDGTPDIVVADFIDGKVFTATGVGNGSFNPPVPYKVGQSLIDIAIGNFDRQEGNDLVGVDQDGNAAVLMNRGGNIGYGAQVDYSVGVNPKRVAAADLNGDGFDDIVVIGSDGGATDYISVLLNNASGGFISPARKFGVGAGAADLAIADFNNDGVPDIVVLNAGLTTLQTSFSMSILINETTVVDCKRIGLALFNSEPPVQLNCPTSINGVPINCHPSFIAAGDFDNDGFMDLAVTVVTQPKDTTSSAQTSGLVVSFKGNGDGTFDFSNQVTVGLNPQGIVAGDFNGDGITDLAIAETGSFSARILTALEAPPILLGASCHLGRQCVAPQSCIDGVCCSGRACPAGQFCDIPGSEGTCALPNPIPHVCTDAHQCETDFCVDGFCCNSPTCAGGSFCNSVEGTCAPPQPDGVPCNSANDRGGNDQCASGHCTDGVCCQDEGCPPNSACNVPVFEGGCHILSAGTPCTFDGQCATGFCTEGFCCGVRMCPTNESCAIPHAEGFCVLVRTSRGMRKPSAPPTPTKRSCDDQLACPSGLVCACDPGAQMRVCDCVGDCDGDNQVTVDELLVMVNAALGNEAVCPLGDANGNGQITVDEIMVAMGNLLHGCAF